MTKDFLVSLPECGRSKRINNGITHGTQVEKRVSLHMGIEKAVHINDKSISARLSQSAILSFIHIASICILQLHVNLDMTKEISII